MFKRKALVMAMILTASLILSNMSPMCVMADEISAESGQRAAKADQIPWDADKLCGLPVLPTDVSSASDGCVMLGIPGEYIADPQATLDRINDIRREACEEGLINPETGMLLTPADYVPLRWSNELERIARIRAAETGLTANHIRTNGEAWNSITSGLDYVGECVAWNYSSSATEGIDQWYNEKEKWMDGEVDESKHYTTMISPSMRYVGAGVFYTPYTNYPNNLVAEFSRIDSDVDESYVDIVGECIQEIEVALKFVCGPHAIQGELEGVKGDTSNLFLTTTLNMDTSLTNGFFGYKSNGICCTRDVEWSSTNTNIATVSSDGEVTARGCGSCTIKADAGSGILAQAEYTVKHEEQTIEGVAPTCTEPGLTAGTRCANCGEILSAQETIPAAGHSMSDWEVTKAATCTEKGQRERRCSNCDYVETEEINATGHSMSDWEVTKAATCTEKGQRERRCSNCEYVETEEINATGHTWNETYTVDEEPTYTKEGVESIHCSVCGEKKDGSERAIAKLIKPISGCTVKGIVSKTYTGRPVTQTVTVVDGSSVLTEGVDYKVSYRANTNAGKAYVVITGIGKYKDKEEKAFDITKAANKITAANVTRTYSTKKTGLALNAKANGGKLTYKSDKSAVKVDKNGKVTIAAKFSGTAKITITAGDANYKTVSKTVTVSVPKAPKLSSVKNSGSKKMTVKWKKNSLATGYQIQYGLKSSFKGANKVTVSKNKTVSAVIKGLKKGKKYYVRIRCYKKIGSKKYYSAWSARKAVIIKE